MINNTSPYIVKRARTYNINVFLVLSAYVLFAFSTWEIAADDSHRDSSQGQARASQKYSRSIGTHECESANDKKRRWQQSSSEDSGAKTSAPLLRWSDIHKQSGGPLRPWLDAILRGSAGKQPTGQEDTKTSNNDLENPTPAEPALDVRATGLSGFSGKSTQAKKVPESSTSSKGGSQDSDGEAWTKAHNDIRKRYSTPPLKWSNQLAASAKKISDGCVFEHSRTTHGENLAAGQQSINAVVADWVFGANECGSYNPTVPQYSHFTQVLWRSTTEVGCSMTKCNSIKGVPLNNAPLWVCHYNPISIPLTAAFPTLEDHKFPFTSPSRNPYSNILNVNTISRTDCRGEFRAVHIVSAKPIPHTNLLFFYSIDSSLLPLYRIPSIITHKTSDLFSNYMRPHMLFRHMLPPVIPSHIFTSV
ncbi:hypothetical protein O181_023014 [Austropuccinia psidii MF-1]|uniref:SCP domain-containing protein n=1 Tax=Austropuccinia psidii MF-1 TaxID=1389203 RepID=A0A9Q3CDN5_9BASI|nr:hypothetical protein [Austropuccinia psidii MF-1]